jgi:formylglycine-generating enzyme required for sulfatase activity
MVGFGSVATAKVNIETVPVGNPGNPNDGSYGAVDYEYNIGKYEVSNAEYCEFLNAVATEGDPHGLYDPDMGGGWSNIGGISRGGSGTAGNPWVYSTRRNRANRPVSYASWGNAARFVNWLHNGQPDGVQDLTTTEDGAYYLNGATTGAQLLAVVREANWKWAIPTEDEWYKAAYHKNDGVTRNYWEYPTCSNTVPTSEMPGGTDMINGSANYRDPGVVDSTYFTTERGAYTAKPSDSPYGTFDQGGNIYEWNEATSQGAYRGLRGGTFNADGYQMRAGHRFAYHPAHGSANLGFRVVEVHGVTPVADAGGPYTIDMGDPLTLNASESTGHDDDIISYVWDLDDDGVYETDAGGDAIHVVSYETLASLGVGAGGLYDIHLKVTNTGSHFHIDESTLTINAFPSADADGPYIIDTGYPLILNASGSTDVDGDVVSYMWDLNDDGVYETDAGGNMFFVVSFDDVISLGLSEGDTYDIHLKVTDATGLFDIDDSSLKIIPEPTTLSFLALGGLAVLRRRRKR